MEKVKRFFRELNEKRAYQVVFFVVSMCVTLGIYVGMHVKLAEDKSHEYIVEKDTNLVKYIEEVSWQNGRLLIKGWGFIKDIDGDNTKIQVFLKNVEDEKDVIWLETKKETREDIDAYFNCEYNYSNVGFCAKERIKKSVINENVYEILIKAVYTVDNSQKGVEGGESTKIEGEKTVSTNRYLVNGELSIIKDSREGGSTKGTLNIFENGQLLIYREDIDIYIYQQGNKLYWVTGEKFAFDEDATTCIEWHLNTTRPDLLPSHRVENQWDNLSFVFERNETEGGSSYRVAVSEIPTEYPVTDIWLGQHADGWVWREEANLDVRMLRKY